MNIAYITAQTPYGNGEQFIPPEIIEVADKGNKVLVIPARPFKNLGKGEEAKIISEYTKYVPIINFSVFFCGLFIFLKNPMKTLKIIYKILGSSGSIKKAFRNLFMLNKGLVTSEILKKNNIQHIHAHWASTSATCAYIASYISGIPWSFTCHRWDITDNNMLKEKARTTKFIRIIDEPGYNEVINLIGIKYKSKCHKIHMGVKISDMIKEEKQREIFTMIVPANLREKKGHRYLIDAIKKLVDEGINKITCAFYGDGPLKAQLEEYIIKNKLENYVVMEGKIAHDKVLELYKNRGIDCVVLPSIVDENGEREGIPVALMEAMSWRVPVISTNTGGIEELLGNGAGIIVEQKDSDQLASAIKNLIENSELRESLEDIGYERIKKEFLISNVVDEMLSCLRDDD
jgi:glycosyltransferase involved in cell wall biosynthesis